MLNNFGLGFSLTADDQASLAMMRLAGNLGALKVAGDNAALSFDHMSGRMRDATTGRFAKRPEGVMNPEFLRDVQGQLKGVSIAALGFGASIFAGLGYAAHEATIFGKSVAEVASITDRAAFPISEIERIGKEMASTYGGDLNLQVKTMYQAASSGATNTAEAMALMHAANKLAVGGLSDSFKAVDALTNVLNAYNMKMGEAGTVSDALFTTAKIGKTTIDELAQQIGRVAPTAAAMGVSLDDLMAGITAGSTQLGNASAAIDGMKEALSGILKPTSDAAAEAARLGIKFDAATLRSKGFDGFLKSITQNAKFNKDTIGKLFGSMTAFNTMSVLAANNSKAFSDALQGMKDKAGATDTAFNTLAETGDFAQTVLKANLQTALVSLGQAIAPVVGWFAKLINKILVGFNKMSPIFQKAVAWIGVVVGGLAIFIGGATGAAAAIAGMVLAGKAFLIGLGAVAAVVGIAVAALAPLIAAGATLYLIWTKDIGGIATRVTLWMGQIKLAFQSVAQLISDGAFSGAVQQELSKAENSGIKQFAINVFLWFSRIKNFIVSLGDSFSKGLEHVSPIFERIVWAISRIIGRFTPVREVLSVAKDKFDAFGNAGAKTGTFLVTIVEKLATGFMAVLAFVDGALEVFQTIRPVLSAVWDAAKGLFEAFGMLFAAFSGGKTNAQSTVEMMRALGNIIGFVANGAIGMLVVAIRIVAGLIEWWSGLIGAAVTFYNAFVNAIVTGVQIVVALFQGDWGKVWKLAEQWVTDWGTAILAMFTKIVGGAAGMIDSLGKVFGKDLGLKAKVEGFAQPAGLPPPVTPNGGAIAAANLALPASAQANGQAASNAQLAAAINASNQKPVEVNSKTTLIVDGNTLAEATSKAQAQQAGRGFAPTPAPT